MRHPRYTGNATISNESPDVLLLNYRSLYTYLRDGLAILIKDELRLLIAYIIKVAVVKTIRKLIIAFPPLKKLTLL